jgi:urease accessory protein
VVVITEPHLHVEPSALEGKARDTLCLTWEERRWTRKRILTTAGREVGLALPTGSLLRPGDVVAVEADWYLEIEGRPEPILAITPRDKNEAIRVAFDVGNRHFPMAISGDDLLVPDDTAMEQLLTRLGVAWKRSAAVFAPLGGGQSHEHGTSALDDHGHSDPGGSGAAPPPGPPTARDLDPGRSGGAPPPARPTARSDAR